MTKMPEVKRNLSFLSGWYVELDENFKIIEFRSNLSEQSLPCPKIETNFSQYLTSIDSFFMTHIFQQLKAGQDIDWIRIGFQLPEERIIYGALNGNYEKGVYHLYVNFPPRYVIAKEGEENIFKGLLNKPAFVQNAQQFLNLTYLGHSSYKLILLHIPNMNPLLESHNLVRQQIYDDKLVGLLRSFAIGGEAVGRLGNDKYGLIASKTLTIEHVRHKIGLWFSDLYGQSARDLKMNMGQVIFYEEGLSSHDAQRALEFIINQFSRYQDFEEGFLDLKKSAKIALEDSLSRVKILRETIERKNFEILFQPIIDIKTGKTHHFEALSRMLGSYSPLSFIAFAEEVGMVEDFDLAVLQKVLEKLKDIHSQGRDISIAMNISARSLESQLFISELENVIKPFHKLRKYLMFEITETSQLQDFTAANKVIQHLRTLGHQIYLDDVGSGMTSFQSLYNLEVDCVKIDGFCIQYYEKDERQKSIVDSIVQVCKQLKITMVAEQIENSDHLKTVEKLGIEFGQGYWFGGANTELKNI